MQILSVTLKNIKSHKETTLDFVSGVNVLSGPNGAGKSTIFEAIGYALFGVDARDFVGNIARFISIGQKKGEISVTFTTDDGNRYRVSRGVGSGSKWLLAVEQDGVFEVEEHSNGQETEARMKELLKLERNRSLADQFKLVIGPFQHDFLGPFVEKLSARQEAFDEILGIDGWRKTYLGTRELLSVVKNKIELLHTEIIGKQEQIVILPEKKKQLTELKKEFRSLKKKKKEKEKIKKKTDRQLASFDSREKEINKHLGELRLLEDRAKNGKEKIANQQKLVLEAEKAHEILLKTSEGKKIFETAEKQLLKLRQQEHSRRELEKEIGALEQTCARLTQELEHEQSEVDKSQKLLEQEKEQLEVTKKEMTGDKTLVGEASKLPQLRRDIDKMQASLGVLDGRRAGLTEGKEKLSGGVCPFFKEDCKNIGGPASPDLFNDGLAALDLEKKVLAGQLEVLNRKLGRSERAQEQLNVLKTRREEIEKQLKAIQDKLSENKKRRTGLELLSRQQLAAQKELTSRTKDLRVFRELDTEIKKVVEEKAVHQVARDTYLANLKDGEALNYRRHELKKMVALMGELQQGLGVGQRKLEQLREKYDNAHHSQVRYTRDTLLAELAAFGQQLESCDKEQLRLDKEIHALDQIKKETEEKLAEKKKMAAKQKLITFLRDQIFKNVSSQLSERFREEISTRADRIYRTIAETDEELNWGDNYEIVLHDMKNGRLRKRCDNQLSGGQIMSAVVALRLALLQTIGARVAFFDEPTSNLDAARRENLAQAFRAIDVGREEVTSHWYDQLFLISHDVAFTEVTDQVILLE